MKNTLKHILILVIIICIMTLGIIYPFLPGKYDALSIPLSIILQGFGLIGMTLSFLGILCLFFLSKSKFIIIISFYFKIILMIILSFFAYLINGLLFGITIFISLSLLLILFYININKLFKKETTITYSLYLIILPLSVLTIQHQIAIPIVEWSRDRTILNANIFIRDIERFKFRNGYYPKTLQAMYKDYFTGIVGIESYYYLPFGDSYNISFEQPKLLLDNIGTREWVVYNPKDEHRVYSHTSWFLLLSPEESEIRQGWYSSLETKHKHWKLFFFD